MGSGGQLGWEVNDLVRGLAHRMDPDRLAACRATAEKNRPLDALVWLAGHLVGAAVPITAQERDRFRALAEAASIEASAIEGFAVLELIRGDYATFRLGSSVLATVDSQLRDEDVIVIRGDLDAGRWAEAVGRLLAALTRGQVPVTRADRETLLRLASRCEIPVSAVAAVPAARSWPGTQ